MVTIVVTHEVKNFQDWKKAFDSDSSNRDKAGLKFNGLYTAVDNQNMVTIIMEAPSMEVINGMLANPDFQKTMIDAGVISKPEVKLLDKKA